VFGYYPEEMKSIGFKKLRSIVHPHDHDRFKKHYNILEARNPEEIESTIEHRIKHKTLGYRWVSHSRTVLFDDSNKPIAVIGNLRDIHNRKQAEMELKKLHEELEEKVKERTMSLEEANSALKVMLKKEEEVRNDFGEKILANVKELILPSIEKMKNTPLNDKQERYMDTLESSLGEIISPFLHTLTSSFLNLTPGEIQIANLIKHGKATKEIAELLNLSTRTIEFHRANIRNKVGIKNKKTSLRSYLLSIS
jgi:PAS domain S-box-containing protein